MSPKFRRKLGYKNAKLVSKNESKNYMKIVEVEELSHVPFLVDVGVM